MIFSSKQIPSVAYLPKHGTSSSSQEGSEPREACGGRRWYLFAVSFADAPYSRRVARFVLHVSAGSAFN